MIQTTGNAKQSQSRPAVRATETTKLPGVPNEPNFRCFGPKTKVWLKNKANLRRAPVRRAEAGCAKQSQSTADPDAERGSWPCQTNPIRLHAPVAGSARPTGCRAKRHAPQMSNEANLPRSSPKNQGRGEKRSQFLWPGDRHWRFGIADWGFGPAGARKVKRSQLGGSGGRRARLALRHGGRNAGAGNVKRSQFGDTGRKVGLTARRGGGRLDLQVKT